MDHMIWSISYGLGWCWKYGTLGWRSSTIAYHDSRRWNAILEHHCKEKLSVLINTFLIVTPLRSTSSKMLTAKSSQSSILLKKILKERNHFRLNHFWACGTHGPINDYKLMSIIPIFKNKNFCTLSKIFQLKFLRPKLELSSQGPI